MQTVKVGEVKMVGVPFKVCLPGGQLVGVVAYNFIHLNQVLKAKFGLDGELSFSLDDGTLICDQDYFELLPPQTKLNVTANTRLGLQSDKEISMREYSYHANRQRHPSDGPQLLPSPVHNGRPLQMLSPPHNADNVAADLRITSVTGNVRMTSPDPRPYIVVSPERQPHTALSPERQPLSVLSPERQPHTALSPERQPLSVLSPERHPHTVPYHQYVNMIQRRAHMEQMARLHQHNMMIQQRMQGIPPPHTVRHTAVPFHHRGVVPIEPAVQGLCPQPVYPHIHNHPIVPHQIPYRTQCRFETPSQTIHHQLSTENHIRQELNPSVITHVGKKTSPPALLRMNELQVPKEIPTAHQSLPAPPPGAGVSTPNKLPCISRPQDLICKVGGSPVRSTMTNTIHTKAVEGVTVSIQDNTNVCVADLEVIRADHPESLTELFVDKPLLMSDGMHPITIHPATVLHKEQSPPVQETPVKNITSVEDNDPSTNETIAVVVAEDSEDEGELYIDESACSTPADCSSPATSIKGNAFLSQTTPEITDTVPDSLLQTDTDITNNDSPVSPAIIAENTISSIIDASVLTPPSKDISERLPFADFDSGGSSTLREQVTSEVMDSRDKPHEYANESASSADASDTNTALQTCSDDENMIVSYPIVHFSPVLKEKDVSIPPTFQSTIERNKEDLQVEVTEHAAVNELKVTIHTMCIDGQVYVDDSAYCYVNGNNKPSCETSAVETEVNTTPEVSPQSVNASDSVETTKGTQATEESGSGLIQSQDIPITTTNINDRTINSPLEVAEYACEEITFTRQRYCSSADIDRCSAELLSVALDEQFKSNSSETNDLSSPLQDNSSVTVQSVLVDSSNVPSSVGADDVSVDDLLEDGDFFKNDDESFTMDLDLSEESEDDTVFHFEEDTIINEVTLPLDVSEPPTPSGCQLIMLNEQDSGMATEVVEMDCSFQASSLPVAQYYASMSTYGYDPNIDIPLGNKASEQ